MGTTDTGYIIRIIKRTLAGQMSLAQTITSGFIE